MNYIAFIPELLVLITASIVLFGEWVLKPVDGSKEKRARNIGFVTLVGLLMSLGTLVAFKTGALALPGSFFNSSESTFYDAFLLDDMALYFKIIIVLSSALTTLISFKYVSDKIRNTGEFYALLCMATLGGMFMASANEMITMYLSIELISISSYILCALNKEKDTSSESALKYFVIGGLSSALLLYGFSVMFGLTGVTEFSKLSPALEKFSNPMSTVFVISMLLAFAGLGYKISIAPFHMWAPDVYQGAPIPVTSFLSITSKIAGFAAFIRFLQIFTSNISEMFVVFLAILSVITMFAGNFMGLVQKDLKRLFAYSSISHAGYVLMGIIPLLKGNTEDFTSVLFYLSAYVFMNIGAFSAITYFSKYTGSTDIDSFAGVAKKSPFVAFVFASCLVSLAGLPPFGGFTGKFYLFVGAVNSGYAWLAFVGALNSVISLYYYVKIIKSMYLGQAKEDVVFDLPNASLVAASFISLVGILALFLAPYPFMQFAKVVF